MEQLIHHSSQREIHRDVDNVLMVLEYVQKLFERIEKDADNTAFIDLKFFISQMTLPVPYNRVLEYGKAVDSSEIKEQLKIQSDTSMFYEGVLRAIRLNGAKVWHTEPDQLLINTFLGAEPLDADSTSVVSMYNGKKYVRVVLPPPEVIFVSTDYEKIRHCSLICLEELLHISQMQSGTRLLHSLGIALLTDEFLFAEKPELLAKLLESDVTQLFLQVFPEMRQQKWKWYQDRIDAPQADIHYPLSQNELVVNGYIYASLLGIEKDYFNQLIRQDKDASMDTSPDLHSVFSDTIVRQQTAKFIITELYDDFILSGLSIPEQEKLLETEFSRSGMTLQYLEHIIAHDHFLTGDIVLDYGKDETVWLQSLKDHQGILNRIVRFLQSHKKKTQSVLGLNSIRDSRELLQNIALLPFR